MNCAIASVTMFFLSSGVSLIGLFVVRGTFAAVGYYSLRLLANEGKQEERCGALRPGVCRTALEYRGRIPMRPRVRLPGLALAEPLGLEANGRCWHMP